MVTRLICLGFILIAFPLTSQGKDTVSKPSAQRKYFESFFETGKDGKRIENVSEFLAYLPNQYKKNYTFVFNSRSPFKDSINESFPRVVLFTDDAKTIITFTGNPQMPGYNTVEFSEYSDSFASFDFYGYNLNDKKRVVSRKNCMDCHGKDSRPIFDSYPVWPGFYGVVLDSFPKDVTLTKKEHNDFIAFKNKNMNTGIYQYLNFEKYQTYSPYTDPANLKVDKDLQLEDKSLKFRPNQKLGIALTQLNRKRIARKLRSSKSYKEKRKQLLFELLDCGFSKVSKGHISRIKKAISLENEERIKRMKVSEKEKKHIFLQMQELKFTREIAQLDWVAIELNVDRSDWSLALENNSLSFFDGTLTGKLGDKSFYIKEDFIFELLKDLSSFESEYLSYFKPVSRLKENGMPLIKKLNLPVATKSCARLRRDLFNQQLKFSQK